MTDVLDRWKRVAGTFSERVNGVDEVTFDHPQAGTHRLDEAIDRFVLSDVLVHTWDLARATGQDETLDPESVDRLIERMEPIAHILVESGHSAPAVPVAPGADDRTRLIALTGRTP